MSLSGSNQSIKNLSIAHNDKSLYFVSATSSVVYFLNLIRGS
jgi:hypothetical protein